MYVHILGNFLLSFPKIVPREGLEKEEMKNISGIQDTSTTKYGFVILLYKFVKLSFKKKEGMEKHFWSIGCYYYNDA